MSKKEAKRVVNSGSVYGKKIVRVSDPWVSSKELEHDERFRKEAKAIVDTLFNNSSNKNSSEKEGI